MTKCWQFDLSLKNKKIETFVYSDNGDDIESRFEPHKVTNIKEINDPLAENKELK
jgi:hypothetical protein